MFDRQVTKVKRFTHGEKADNQQQADLTRRGGIDGILHRALVIGVSGLSKENVCLLRNSSASANFAKCQQAGLVTSIGEHAFENIAKSASLSIGVFAAAIPFGFSRSRRSDMTARCVDDDHGTGIRLDE
jgi:hypothetical protein